MGTHFTIDYNKTLYVIPYNIIMSIPLEIAVLTGKKPNYLSNCDFTRITTKSMFFLQGYSSVCTRRSLKAQRDCLGWVGWVNQAYSRLSTTHGHITDCKLDSVVYAGVCV